MKKLSELLFLKVVARDGKTLGRVMDFRSPGEPEHGDSREERMVSEIVYAATGFLERVGVRKVEEKRIPWESVLDIKDGKIIVDRISAE